MSMRRYVVGIEDTQEPRSLSPLLQELLAGYLEDHPSLVAQELLVLFLLQRSRYVEAQHIQEKIRPIAKVSC